MNFRSSISGWCLLVCLIALSGCATLDSARVGPLDGMHSQMADFPGDRRGVWIMQSDHSYKICAEPPGDVGANLGANHSLAFKKDTVVDAGINDVQSVNVVELKGRSPAVLALRDVMYRLCEARLNVSDGKIPDSELLIYKDIIIIIGKFAAADLEDAQTQKAVALGTTETLAQARSFEHEGYTALAKKDFDLALAKFNACEAKVNGFRACYDIAFAIRNNKNNAAKAKAVLKYRDYLPADTAKAMDTLITSDK